MSKRMRESWELAERALLAAGAERILGRGQTGGGHLEVSFEAGGRRGRYVMACTTGDRRAAANICSSAKKAVRGLLSVGGHGEG